MIARTNDIILLLGAGASVDADIPASQGMVHKIEALFTREDWEEFRNLYLFLKSSILYAAGLRGEFNERKFYNVETLVNAMRELERRENHPLYPFVSDWKSRVITLAGPEFRRIEVFRKRILEQLKGWVQPENKAKAGYYAGLRNLQQHLGFPLKAFSLNYDRCVEQHVQGDDFKVQTGFELKNDRWVWDWRQFDESNPRGEKPAIYLYKLHGSIDWKREEDDSIVRVDYAGSNIPADKLLIIFGGGSKLEADDPYLFYAYEFRRCTLESKVILALGYGFGDEHINKMIRQAIRHDPLRRIAVVTKSTEAEREAKAKAIAAKLDIELTRVNVIPGTAREFLERKDIGPFVVGLLPPDKSAPF